MDEEIARELHKPVIRHFERRKVIVNSIDDVWACDLVDMTQTPDGKYKYILTVIDIMSKYAWAVPLTNKRGSSILDAIEDIMKKSNRRPNKFWTDSGTEFYNANFKKFLKENNMSIYSVYNENHSAVIERFNRTLKEKMWFNFSKNKKEEWFKLLPKLMENYNQHYHQTIKMTPLEASSKKHEEDLTARVITAGLDKDKPKFKVGDRVRISRIKKRFEKGYTKNWSIEVFTVHIVRDTTPITYKIIDNKNEVIEGSFYENELQHSIE